MTIRETQKLVLGLYWVNWKDGGQSLAAVGQTADGKRWLAPCNWLGYNLKTFRADLWRKVAYVELIMPARTEKAGAA
jgi:hypothetical protein